MRVQAQVEVSAEELKYPCAEEFVQEELKRRFGQECIKNLIVTQHVGFAPGSKIFAVDAFLITQKDFTWIMEYLDAIDFLAGNPDKECVAKIKALLRK